MVLVAWPTSSGKLTVPAAPSSSPVRKNAASPAGPDSRSAACRKISRRTAAAFGDRGPYGDPCGVPAPGSTGSWRRSAAGIWSRTAGSTCPDTTGTITASHRLPAPVRHAPRGDQLPARFLQPVMGPLALSADVLGAGLLGERVQHRVQRR